MSLSRRSFRLILAAGLAWLCDQSASAQLVRGTGGVRLPATSVAAPDDAYALETNPAALAYIPGWEVAYVHAETRGDRPVPSRGDGLYGALGLPFRLAIGAALDWRRPAGIGEGLGERDSGRFTLGLAWSRDRRLAVGGAVRFTVSEDPRFDDVTSLDVGVTWRPRSWIAASVVGPRSASALGSSDG